MDQLCPIHISRARFSRPQLQNIEAVHSIYRLFQDSLGFIWAGSQYGLFRLDSSEARSFRPDPDDPYALPGKFIIGIGECHSGRMLIGTSDAGVIAYDPALERFTPFDIEPVTLSDGSLRSVATSPDGRTWLGTLGSLTEYDPASGSIRKHFHPDVDDTRVVTRNAFPVVRVFDEQHLLLGTGHGAFMFDIRSGRFSHIPFHEPMWETKPIHNVLTVAQAGDTWYVGTGYFHYLFNQNEWRLEPVLPVLNHVDRGERYVGLAMETDSIDGRLWVGTNAGLFRFDANEREWTEFPYDESDPSAPCGPEVHALLRDRSGMLWAGGRDGVALLDLRYNFQYHRVRDVEQRHFVRVSGMIRGEDGRPGLLGTNDGLYEWNESTGEATRVEMEGVDDRLKSDTDSIRRIRKGASGIWLATDRGLFQWDQDGDRITAAFYSDPIARHAESSPYLLGTNVKGVLEDRRGYVWSGSDGLGLQRLDPGTGEFTYYLREASDRHGLEFDTLMTSEELSDGTLLFGFSMGIAEYDYALDRFSCYQHDPSDRETLTNNMVLAILEASGGDVWVGTAGGLNRMYRRPDRSLAFRRFTIYDGLPNSPIVSIVEHESGLWLGTNDGIVHFRLSNGDVGVRTYTRSEGLHTNIYGPNAALALEGGRLLFGGTDGYDAFSPERLVGDDIPPPIVITELRLFNKTVPIRPPTSAADSSTHLSQSMPSLRELRLSYRDSVVSFRYAALHFRQADRIRFEYMLEGFDRGWIEAGNKTEATYTNLDPGRYEFVVRAVNSDGVHSMRPARVRLQMEPPPWRTWWAHSLYGLAGAGALAAYTRWRVSLRERELREKQRLRQARDEERESIRRQNAADFHDEAGTTLTRILFLTELVRRRGDDNPELRGMLEKIEQNTTRLAQGMRDFIWVLDPDKDTLLDTLQRIEMAGEALFGPRDTSFSMQYDHQALRDVSLDLNQRRQILMICKEALNNVARHAAASSVLVRVIRSEADIVVDVEDDGRGIQEDAGNGGYGMKSMLSRAESIDATLSVRSWVGDGTTVTLKIPHMGN